MVKRIILYVFLYAVLITTLTLTMSQTGDTYLIIITLSGLVLGGLIVREVYKKYFTAAIPRNNNLEYGTFNSGERYKISGKPFLFGFEKKIVSGDDFYFDDDYFYAVNKNQQAAKFDLKDITELSKTSYQINNSRIWQVKINNIGEEVAFKFAHNYSVWNKNFLNFYNKLKEINPSAVQSKWSLWSM
ncbi:hypothetical protein MKJ01_00840 [Chryseobacterium sp. SSA4.19]|uniref:hypothetical protein n=1 Tax=Chryseobacterium sp. SSA4.19 TaxID=2919915 RepID=UPI001F4DAE00|nr:hypothetical protein [Chryseobacterium sp. SSA4.19]MCJ8152303.1 hypothetical protein [Chryseobacterium sp. SSA4.19]